jgi:tetratricopeptide (TPR) repeat protein
MNLGATHVRQRNVALARLHLGLGSDLFAQAQSRDFLPELMRHQARASIITGELDLAREQIDESLRLARELHSRSEEGSSLRVLGQISQAQGNWAEAKHYLTQSVVILAEVGEEYELARSRHALALVLHKLGQIEEARPLLSQSLDTFTRLEAQVDLTAVQNLLAQLDTGIAR